MRLLKTSNGILREFSPGDIPKYAILSHTWGDHEQTFQEVNNRFSRHLKGVTTSYSRHRISLFEGLSRKIQGCCRFARSYGYEWVWIDTCCIDQKSSAELSEAINSMFEWYSKAELCIAFLEDVPDSTTSDDHRPPPRFKESRWFTRGWTLQELIAPNIVIFVSSELKFIGTKATLAKQILDISGISRSILTSRNSISDYSIAQRMRWAAKRVTTRPEDRAYSLLGIFGVHMPTIYGEGLTRAFRRLQEEIIKVSQDQSIFSWDIANKDSIYSDGGISVMNNLPTQFAQSLSAPDPLTEQVWTPSPLRRSMAPFVVHHDSDYVTVSRRGKHNEPIILVAGKDSGSLSNEHNYPPGLLASSPVDFLSSAWTNSIAVADIPTAVQAFCNALRGNVRSGIPQKADSPLLVRR